MCCFTDLLYFNLFYFSGGPATAVGTVCESFACLFPDNNFQTKWHLTFVFVNWYIWANLKLNVAEQVGGRRVFSDS